MVIIHNKTLNDHLYDRFMIDKYHLSSPNDSTLLNDIRASDIYSNISEDGVYYVFCITEGWSVLKRDKLVTHKLDTSKTITYEMLLDIEESYTSGAFKSLNFSVGIAIADYKSQNLLINGNAIEVFNVNNYFMFEQSWKTSNATPELLLREPSSQKYRLINYSTEYKSGVYLSSDDLPMLYKIAKVLDIKVNSIDVLLTLHTTNTGYSSSILYKYYLPTTDFNRFFKVANILDRQPFKNDVVVIR